MKKLIILIELIIIILLLIASNPEAEIEVKHFIMISTGYCPCKLCCSPFDTGLTYTGDIAGRGYVAIDPEARILRMGQKLYIEGKSL